VDLVHWRQHPPALYPTLGSVDRGMFSGNCFINKRGEATMLYHGVDAGNSIATSTDELLDKWERLPSNPIIPNRRPNDPYDSWDPHGWVEGNTYYAIFGGQANPWPATLFKATELDRWRYVGKFFHHEMPDVAANEDTGCPDFFKMGNKWVFLCISHGRGARYYVGDWKNEQFHPEIHERMSWNDPLVFAPETLLGPDGRRIMWAWIHDCRNHATRAPSGWFGEMSLPRELSLRPDNRLNIRPVRELERLRYNERTWPNGTIAAGSDTKWDGLSGNTLELLIEIEPGNAKRFGLKVCRSPDGAEETVITYDVGKQKLEVDLSKSSREDHVKKNEAAPLTLNPREPLSLRVFIDKSVLEVFANDRQAVVRRMYPTRPDSTGISIFTEDASIRIRQIKSWQMAPSNAW
jgi:beta-fructofuranosidase